MKKLIAALAAMLVLFSGCAAHNSNDPPTTERAEMTMPESTSAATTTHPDDRSDEALQALAQDYLQNVPTQWGLAFDGIVSRFEPTGKQLALTLDACGGSVGGGIDTALMDFLSRENIPATLFVSGRWAEQNRETLKALAENPLFSIQNHGGAHKPLSVTPREAYGIKAAGSVAGVMEEVLAGERIIQEITGARPRFFRSGTAHYDDVSVRLLQDLGYLPAGFSVNGDGGATFTARQVRAALMACQPGDIILGHIIDKRRKKPPDKICETACNSPRNLL